MNAEPRKNRASLRSRGFETHGSQLYPLAGRWRVGAALKWRERGQEDVQEEAGSSPPVSRGCEGDDRKCGRQVSFRSKGEKDLISKTRCCGEKGR